MLQIIQIVFFWFFLVIAAAGALMAMSIGMAGAVVITAGRNEDPGSTRWMKVGFAMMIIGSGGVLLLSPY